MITIMSASSLSDLEIFLKTESPTLVLVKHSEQRLGHHRVLNITDERKREDGDTVMVTFIL